MSKKEELEEAIKVIDQQISDLKKEKCLLEEEYNKSSEITFPYKFSMWYCNGEEKDTLGDVFDLEQYPNTQKFIKGNDWSRYQTIDILDYYCEKFDFLIDPDHMTLKEKEKYIGIAKEMIEGNFDSVEIDW